MPYVHCRIMECMRDYKGKEETVKHLLDQYRITHESKHILLLLRIIYEQAVTRSVKAEHQDAFQILLPFDIGKSVFPKGVEGVKISPEPVVSGEDISGGRVVIKISYFGFHVPTFMTSVMRQAV
ncbi:hypothetical protein F2Q70_00012168 [Brassica cretica]|uniref:Uncharacterized protein n=1 Tax=Brassica cretica TaxID=69181 RepID=A0A8S9M9Y1_BRACR|nr:hypothetical protein F2Q70_00012168 [Brassica cretica]KAF3544541.1 hypothetical protein DY000_02008000 [Brassica cretica]